MAKKLKSSYALDSVPLNSKIIINVSGTEVDDTKEKLIASLQSTIDALQKSRSTKKILAEKAWPDGVVVIENKRVEYKLCEQLAEELGVCEDVARELLEGTNTLPEFGFVMHNEINKCKDENDLKEQLADILDEEYGVEDAKYFNERILQLVICNGKPVKPKFKTVPAQIEVSFK